MSSETGTTAQTRFDVPIPALLGLREGADATIWAQIRATQLFAGRQLALFLLAANLMAGAVVVMMFQSIVALWQLVGWSVALGVVSVGVTTRRLSVGAIKEGYASLSQVRDTWLEGVALAAIWSVPPLLFSSSTPGAVFALWMIVSVLMTAAAVAMAALALAAISFVVGLAVTMALPLFFSGDIVPAAATLLFAGLLVVACIGRARTVVLLRGAELALSEQNETVSLLLREFEDTDADWLWETDAARRIVKASPRFAIAMGLDPKTINGMPFLQALAGPAWETGVFAPALRDLAERMKKRESFSDLCVPVNVAGEEHWWEMTASPRTDETGKFVGFRGVGSDVTEQRASAEKISRMARFDTLTGLPNRLLVTETLRRAMAEADKWGSRCAFMMIDLDRFKAVNDTLGHPIGDRLLSRVSERLAQLMSENDLIGRLGGDEFAVVVHDASDGDRVEMIARRIIDTLSQPYEVDQHTIYIGASVGIATSPRDGRTVETLIRSTDLALYRSKDAGGGAVHSYEPELHVEAEERRVLEIALRQALSNGELQLHYQPVVEAQSGRLEGFEALLRWVSPTHGNVSPARFIPVAEEARLIGPIGEWVVRTACEEAAKWPGDTRVAVNVSPMQLHNPNFVTVVAQSLAATGLSPNRLELEVTESVFMREGTGAVQVLERILDLGVRLSLDDFGTGYSSLGYLSRTRFSTIKIDRSFVQGAAKGVPEALAIICAVVALARNLNMATTAEGVETDSELAMVRELGCAKIQGFYFGRPLPVAEARAIAMRHGVETRAA